MESKGTKRTLASIFAIIASIAPAISWLAPYTDLIISIAGAWGAVGVGHAGISKIKKAGEEKK